MVRDEPSTEMLPEQVPQTSTPTAPVVAGSLIGRTFGRFAIVEQLGRGGSGDVYRAEQAQLGRSAVIKVLRRDASGGHAAHRIERFLREAKLASKLDHPYAAHVYAFGAEPDGSLWIAMEHVRGRTLDELLVARGAMPPPIFGPLFGRLCEVIHTAHDLGIIHRDIKGSNVMVIERAGQLLPKLLDFGIAKLGDDHKGPEGPAIASGSADDKPISDSSNELTQAGSTLGSPHYMAPEQWADAANVDARSDIYALGALAYRCLAGNLPFRDTDRGALARAHQSRPPPPLPDRLPRALDEVVARALAKKPTDRWATALAFGEAVRAVVGSAAPEVVPIFDPYTRDVWLRAGPQPLADGISRLVGATTTVEADAALRELVAVACRWLAVLGLAAVLDNGSKEPGTTPQEPGTTGAPSPVIDPQVRERLRAVVGRDDAGPWLELARVATANAKTAVPGLVAAIAGSDPLLALANRLDDRDRARTALALAENVAAASESFKPLEPLIAYTLVVGRGDSAESWVGTRRRDRELVIVWGEERLAEGDVALLDAAGHLVLRLSPFVQVFAPLPSAEPELFVLWRSGRGAARLVAAPWGFERDDPKAGERLAALTTEDSDTAHDPADDKSPYPGLAAYGVDDAERFVGREREVEALANRLIRAPMIAVLGPSGAGKSSFIHAGVLPRIGDAAIARQKSTSDAAPYRVLTMRPGRHPMHALAALPPVGGDSVDGGSIALRLRELGESARGGLVIVVDQLEELVTLCNDPAERARFAETLAAAADGPSAPVRVVVTLRDDFAGVLESETGFRGRFEIFVLGTPAPDALRRIVVEPARRAAVTVDPRVVDDMVAEVAGRPASLPLLSFTTSLLWAARDRTARLISHDSYQALGGVAGALSTYADQIFESLARRDQDVARALFARLVSTDGTRVPVPRAELEQLSGARAVLAHLIDARLLVVRDDEAARDKTGDVVEIVHEVLAERWTRLARWRQEDASDRALVGDLRVAARRWEGTSRRDDLLWRGELVHELQKLVGRGASLTDLERAFADASIAARLRARRLRRGIVIAVIATLASVAGVMAYLGVTASRNAAVATSSTALAEDRLTQSLVAQGRTELNDGRPNPALAYFAEAMKRGADSRALRFMVSIAARGWKQTSKVHHGPNMIASTPSSDGKFMLTGDEAGVVRWWKADGTVDAEYKADVGVVHWLGANADGSLVIDGKEGVTLIDANKTKLAHFKPLGIGWTYAHGPAADEVTVIELEKVRVYGFDGKVRRERDLPEAPNELSYTLDAGAKHLLWVANRKTEILDLVTFAVNRVHENAGSSIFGSPDGKVFGYYDRDRGAHVIDSMGKERFSAKPKNSPNAMVFTRNAERVAFVGQSSVALYDVTDGSEMAVEELGADIMLFVHRMDEYWVSSTDAILRHYKRGILVSSIPVEASTINFLYGIGDGAVAFGADGTMTFFDMKTDQLQAGTFADTKCDSTSMFGAYGIVGGFTCKGKMTLYYGRRVVGVVDTAPFETTVALAPNGRAAVDNGIAIHLFDRDGKLLLRDPPIDAPPRDPTTAKSGAMGFLDDDHLLVTALDQPLWRWTISANKWDKLLPSTKAASVAAAAGGIALGTDKGVVVVREVGGAWREDKSIELGDRVQGLVTSDDRRWLAVTTSGGGVMILDGTTFEIVRTLEPGDASGALAQFDPSGEFITRPSHGAISVYERSTGDPLVYGLDLMRGVSAGWMLADGRIETFQYQPGLLDIPIDMRPIAQILADIACHVPMKINGSRVEPAPTSCP